MNDYPIRLVVTDDLRRSRLTVFFRYLLALPHIVWLALYGIAAYIVLFIAWFAALFMAPTRRLWSALCSRDDRSN